MQWRQTYTPLRFSSGGVSRVRAQFPSFLRQVEQFRLTASPHDVKPDAAYPDDMVEVPVSSPAQTLKVDVSTRCWPWTAAAQS
jgi:hypothetical protein